MTYGNLIKRVRAHHGRIYACINGMGGQYHIPINKAATLKEWQAAARTYGAKHDTDITVDLRGCDLFIDSVDPNEEDDPIPVDAEERLDHDHSMDH